MWMPNTHTFRSAEGFQLQEVRPASPRDLEISLNFSEKSRQRLEDIFFYLIHKSYVIVFKSREAYNEFTSTIMPTEWSGI